jgi:ketosteroid isomerase-like protein
MAAYSIAEDPAAVVRQYVNAFNKGDVKAMAVCFAKPGSILDGLAPHVWHGPTAAENWYRDAMLAGDHEGASEYSVTLGQTLHADVKSETAYVVHPATMQFKLRGKQITQSGATFTLALRKVADEWHITAWAWAKGTTQSS